MRSFLLCALMFPLSLVALSTMSAARAAEEVLVIEQDYNIVEMGKGGAEGKDVRQILYICRDFVCIDELGGTASGPKIVESIMLDLKNRKIINLDHQNKKILTESFESRRKRIDDKKKEARDNIEGISEGPQRDKVEKLWHAMLDDNRHFVLVPDVNPPKTIANVECKQVTVKVEKEKGYTPMEAYLHPDLELPYDNTEVLYLLRIIGRHLADFLRENKDTFKKVPMELHIDLAAGGKLDTKVVNMTKTTTDKLDITARGALGNPFEVPANYTEKDKAIPQSTNPKTEKP